MIGRATRIDSARERYIEFAKRTLPKNIRFDGIRAVIDCANGAGYKRAPEARWSWAPRSSRSPSPTAEYQQGLRSTSPEDLIRKVSEVRADIGIALDGDADRVVIVDEKGRIIDGDQLMAVIAESRQARAARRRRHRRHGDVQSWARALSREHRSGPGPHTGRRPLRGRYAPAWLHVGGEQSGHIVLSDFSTTGDGLVTALQLLSVVAQSGKPVSEICNRFEPLPQVLKNVRYKNGQPLDNVGVQRAIHDGKSKLGKSGRLRSGHRALSR